MILMVKTGSKELKFHHNDCVVSSNSIIKKNWVSIVLFEANIIKLSYVIIKINNTKFQNELGKCKALYRNLLSDRNNCLLRLLNIQL